MNEVVSIVSFASIKRGVGNLSWSIRKLEILELAILDIDCIYSPSYKGDLRGKISLSV